MRFPCTIYLLCKAKSTRRPLGKKDLHLHLNIRTWTYLAASTHTDRYVRSRQHLSVYLPACGVPCLSTKITPGLSAQVDDPGDGQSMSTPQRRASRWQSPKKLWTRSRWATRLPERGQNRFRGAWAFPWRRQFNLAYLVAADYDVHGRGILWQGWRCSCRQEAAAYATRETGSRARECVGCRET